ncbi:MAG: VWA domain-containing protein [Candidatus Nealsonbacteria bacterium]|nr:VWA domain-containing protein [Candidatus Nealsonbacteria bacterium]
MEDAPRQFELIRPWWLAALIVLPLLLPLIYYWRRSLVRAARWQRIASLVVRTLLIVVAVAAVCGPKVTEHSRQQYVVFAVDESLSITEEAEKTARAYLDEARKHAGGHRTAVLPFAARPGTTAENPKDLPREARTGTNLAAAITEARASIPAEYVPRIVLLCDGNQTAGNALTAARAANAPISTVPLPGMATQEVLVTAVDTPGEVLQGEPFYVEVVVRSTHAADGILQLRDDSQSVVERPVELAAGENRFLFRRSINDRTTATLTATIRDVPDTLAENNRAAAVVCAPRPIRVLLVERVSAAAGPLTEILRGQGIDVTTCLPGKLPTEPAKLRPYDLLVLANVPAASVGETGDRAATLTDEQAGVIGQYLSDGGGLMVGGGDRAFTSGDYHETKLEEMLPVLCEVGKDRPRPPRAMVLVIDESDSMQGQSIELAKQAARLAVERLGPRDQIGVIGFKDRSRWISEIRFCTDEGKQFVRGRIDTIDARGGGTNIYPAMHRAYLALDEAYAELKHVIVLSDGLSQPGDFDRLTGEIAEAGITVSTVGMGEEAVGELLRRIAELGGGRYYACDDPADVPKAFATEAANPPKAGIVEEVVSPQPADPAEMFADLDLTGLPRLLGYVETQPKPLSSVVLQTDTGDPLLAWRRDGRGTSVAFTSEVGTAWSPGWLKWPGHGRFWAEVVRHAMRKTDRERFEINVRRSGDRVYIVLDALNEQGRFLNGATATVATKNGKAPLRQIAPGRYAAGLAVAPQETAHFTVTVDHDTSPPDTAHRGLAPGYADEFRVRSTDESLLREIAKATGGRYDPQPADVFAASKTTVPRTVYLWHYLLIVAVVLLVIDVALKRVTVGQGSP